MKQEYITYEKALKKAMYLCSKAEKCKFDIRKKLYDWKVNPKEHDKVIKQLENQQFIDEKRYIRFYVKDKFNFNKWGKIKIRMMLFQKQLPKKFINDELCNIKQKDYTETLKNIIAQKDKQLKETDIYKRKNKLLQFATGRGFEPNLILQLLEK